MGSGQQAVGRGTLGDPLLDPQRLSAYLQTHHLGPLQRFGQHFLIDAEVLNAMVAASETDLEIPTIEIGAGLGVLTRALARERELRIGKGERKIAPLLAVERDRRLIPLLTERVREFRSVHAVAADILGLDVVKHFSFLNSHFSIPPYDVIGNIPYNITAPIFRKFLTQATRPRRLTFLTDQAVAEAIAAKPPHMSIRAISVQVFAEPRIVR
ncbi:MAG: rRNA adenine N-6-methyltransferase family protein, partial [bacterium]|nr:rRNA adenine N-6-methyltransferase family protein [bacterium]